MRPRIIGWCVRRRHRLLVDKASQLWGAGSHQAERRPPDPSSAAALPGLACVGCDLLGRAPRRASERERTGQHRTARTASGEPPELDGTARGRTRRTWQDEGRKTQNPTGALAVRARLQLPVMLGPVPLWSSGWRKRNVVGGPNRPTTSGAKEVGRR
jgi:hypothetical protein